jgi:hypothetical protein
LLCYPDGAASQPCSAKEETMKAYDWDNLANKLDLAIVRNFDTNTAQELTACIDYRYSESEHKMRLVLKQKLAISEHNKNLLKQLIKGIYGDDTEIVTAADNAKKADVAELPQSQEKKSAAKVIPLNARAKSNNHPTAYRGNHSLTNETGFKPIARVFTDMLEQTTEQINSLNTTPQGLEQPFEKWKRTKEQEEDFDRFIEEMRSKGTEFSMPYKKKTDDFGYDALVVELLTAKPEIFKQ